MFPWQHGENQFDQITYLITHIYEVLQALKRQNPSNRCMEKKSLLKQSIFFLSRETPFLRVHSKA